MHSDLRPWGNLVPELLELITNRLMLADRLSIDRVCKRWSSVVRAVPLHNGLAYGFPCLASINYDGDTCSLVDPFGNAMHMKCSNLPCGCMIYYSKGGWLLVVSGKSIFFFNPLTKRRINLPDVNFDLDVFALAFSAPPTSPDCLVIAMDRLSRFDAFVCLCRRGDDKWTQVEVNADEEARKLSFHMSNVSPVFYQGRFYCLGDGGRLGVFDPNKVVWSLVPNPKPRQELRSKAKYLYLVESDGELLLVSTDKFGDWVYILKLDPLSSQWRESDTIRDTSLFVGLLSSICSKVSVFGGNRIYFPRVKDGEYMFYSCEERKFHPSGNFYGSELFPLSFWIEPVWFQPSSPEEQQMLKWSE